MSTDKRPCCLSTWAYVTETLGLIRAAITDLNERRIEACLTVVSVERT